MHKMILQFFPNATVRQYSQSFLAMEHGYLNWVYHLISSGQLHLVCRKTTVAYDINQKWTHNTGAWPRNSIFVPCSCHTGNQSTSLQYLNSDVSNWISSFLNVYVHAPEIHPVCNHDPVFSSYCQIKKNRCEESSWLLAAQIYQIFLV